jgi:hypothetical protein
MFTAIAALFFFAGVGTARIVSTYHTFSQTTDEPAHLVTGLELLVRGTYTLEPLHPPLARIAIALGPYLSGLTLTGQKDMWKEGNDLLLANGRYLHNLSLARLGVLPFFLLATFLVWYWGRVLYGNGPALIATLLFTTSPIVLAHAGLATTDIALTATFTGALVAYTNLLKRPSYFRSATLGVALGLATLSKFSALAFMPACGLVLLGYRWFLEREESEKTETPAGTHQFRWSRGLLLAALATFLVIWSGYRFSIGSITDAAARPHPTVDHLFGARGTLWNWANSVAECPMLPAPAFFRGLAALREKEASGHKGYLLGQIRQKGWWYFFPVALAVKTSLPFLIFVVAGIHHLSKSAWRERDWIAAAPVVAASALLLVCMPSHINIGVRHILPIYPLLAMIAGAGAWRLWNLNRPRYGGITLVLIFLGWHLTSSIRAHPDYLAYFNEFAGSHPEKILIDSDLDWGQDLLRLAGVLHQKSIERVSIAYAGSPEIDLHQFNLPPIRVIAPHQHTVGWIAISLLRLKIGGLGFPDDSFTWLEAYKPVFLVGRSIRLYYVPELAPNTAKERVSKSPARDGQ